MATYLHMCAGHFAGDEAWDDVSSMAVWHICICTPNFVHVHIFHLLFLLLHVHYIHRHMYGLHLKHLNYQFCSLCGLQKAKSHDTVLHWQSSQMS